MNYKVIEFIKQIDMLCSFIGGEDSCLHHDRKVDKSITDFKMMKEHDVRLKVVDYVLKLKSYDEKNSN